MTYTYALLGAVLIGVTLWQLISTYARTPGNSLWTAVYNKGSIAVMQIVNVLSGVLLMPGVNDLLQAYVPASAWPIVLFVTMQVTKAARENGMTA